jgi:transposase
MSKQRRQFTPEFKEEAVALVVRHGQSANQVAKDLGIGQTSVSRWLRQAKTAPAKVNGFQAAEELKHLRREVERLRMERDILKKAAAFFAKESA